MAGDSTKNPRRCDRRSPRLALMAWRSFCVVAVLVAVHALVQGLVEVEGFGGLIINARAEKPAQPMRPPHPQQHDPKNDRFGKTDGFGQGSRETGIEAKGSSLSGSPTPDPPGDSREPPPNGR